LKWRLIQLVVLRTLTNRIPSISSKFKILKLLNPNHALHITVHNMTIVTQNK